MKKIFIFLVALATSVSSFAYYGETKLTINTNYQRNITVMVDGFAMNNYYNNNQVQINDLNAGNHRVKIYQEQRNFWGRTKTRVIYESAVCLKPDFETTLSIDGNCGVAVSEQPIYNGRDRNRWGAREEDRNNNGNGWGKRDDDRKDWDRDRHNDDHDRDHNRDNNGRGYNQPMNQQTFENFKQSIRNGRFDDTKVNIAKQGMSNNYFSANQVKELVQLFSFDDSRLEIAKAGYNNCIDKQNYFVVSDALTFSSSKDELARYLRTVR